MDRIFGLETEYGITIDGVKDVDVVEESMQLVRCYQDGEFVPLWDYGLENPRKDVRGFEVKELLNEADEKVHLQKDRKRKIPFEELKSDLIIYNGARFYNDHTHPEYSTGECSILSELVAQDKAGERVVDICAGRRTAALGKGKVRVYKNNTDFEGHSYGCHENYLIGRELAFQQVIDGLVPFLVTRQVYTGAGKVGVEQDRRARAGLYQLSQRADFFETIAGVDTMHRRPLVNTRDEPHARADRYRRLHLIVGDANMSEYATALKVGTTLLVLDLLEAGLLPRLALADPVAALKQISRDPQWEWSVALADGTQASALEVQHAHLDRARSFAAGRDAETDWVLAEWATVLAQLERDPLDLVGRCDWVTKKWLLDAFVESERLDWESPDHRAWLQSQDLEYHNVDPSEGLFLLLEGQGRTARLTREERIRRALVHPPPGTRAYFRGTCLTRFGEAVRALNWDAIDVELDGRVATIDLKDCVDARAANSYNQLLDRAESIEDLMRRLPSDSVSDAGQLTRCK